MAVMERDLHNYLERGEFKPIELSLSSDISAPILITVRTITPVETYFRLGDELLRIDRADAAEPYFTRSQQLAPASPLPYEGLGMLASERDQHETAIKELKEALQRGSTNFLAHYIFAKEKLRLNGDADERYHHINGDAAGEIRSELQRSIALMPDFAPAHRLWGFLEMVQGDDLGTAEQQLQQAIQLEPENSSYLLSLAQLQILEHNAAAARQTLAPLLLPSVDPQLRAPAEELIKEIEKGQK
jgi:Flp pilus assembly protein TadD